MARFVTANAIELKLGTHVPLGNSYLETKSRTDIIPNVATRGQYVKCYDALFSVWVARFVTASAIELKLNTHIPLDDSYL